MPRLTDAQYLKQRQRLRRSWFEFPGRYFAELGDDDQQDLHDYFVPSEPFTDADALYHRRVMTERHPSLPQVAGRAYKRIEPFLDDPIPAPAPVRGAKQAGHSGSRHVTVKTVLRPHPDVHRLARVITTLMAEDLKRQRAQDKKRPS